MLVTVGELAGENGFYVADDGPRSPGEDRNQLFEAGYSTTRQGTELGLSIVEQIADAHRWNIEVRASDDGGARFEFYSPNSMA